MSNPLDPDGFPKPQDDFDVQQNPFVSPAAEEVRGQGYRTPADEPLNPWFSMWLKARATVRQKLDTDPTRHVLLLAMLGGASAQSANSACAFPEELAFRLASLFGLMLLGAMLMVLWLYIAGWLIGLTGRSVGGVASALECRTALALCFIPGLWIAPINLLFGLYYVALGREAIFVPERNKPPADLADQFALMPSWMWAVMAIGIIVALWQLVITCQSVGEAHQFSSLRGLGALLLAFLALTGLFIAFFVFFGLALALFALGFG